MTYSGRDNNYVFTWGEKNISMVSNCNHPNTIKVEEKSFLIIATTDAEFESETRETKEVHVVVVRALVTDQRSEIMSYLSGMV